MFQRKINSTELTERLNADFYGPVYLANQRKLDSIGCVPLSTYYKATGIGHTAAVEPHYAKDGEESVPFVAGKSIKDGVVDSSSCERIKLASHIENMRKSILKPGDLLTIRKGDPGNSGVVPENEKDCNCSSEIIFFKGVVQQDAYFLSSFLNSYHGHLAFRRLQRGTMIPGVSLLDVPSFGVPRPQGKVRRYIGDKVRQAERLRVLAKWLEKSFETHLRVKFPEAFVDKRTGRKHSLAIKQDISYTLNPGAFDEERIRVQRYLKAYGGKPLQDMATISAIAISGYEKENRYIGLDTISSNSCQLRPVTVASAGVIGSCRLLNEGPVVAKLRPYLNKVSYIPSWLSGAVGSTELMCVKAKGDLSGWYLYGVLKSEATLKQLRPLASGATHPRIDKYDLYHIVIPVLPQANEMGDMLAQAQAAYFASGFLTTAAKLLVEALIEGQITESQLVTAQQALEAGDDSLDRTILARLKTDGLDGAGEPLFPELDQLYDLLERAKPETEA